MRIGILLNEPTGPDGLRGLTDELRRAADEGFDSAWLTHIFGVDALTSLAVAVITIDACVVGVLLVIQLLHRPAVTA